MARRKRAILPSALREIPELNQRPIGLRQSHWLLCRNVSGVFGSRRGDDTNRRTFQPRRYGRTPECVIHVEIIGMAPR